jgi:hypothetical protein
MFLPPDVPDNVRHHLIRAECGAATYEEDTTTNRLSVKVPLGAPEPGASWSTLLFRFMCLGSCVGGINRRALQIIFTLETSSGQIVGRHCLGVRICACPSRDRKVEERKHEMSSSGETVLNLFNGPLNILPLARKRSGSVNSNSGVNIANRNQNNQAKMKGRDEDQVYILKVIHR